MFNECFVYRRWRKQNRRTNLTRNRNVFLDFQTCLSLKQGRSLHSIVNMINHDLSHMLPRLEELLNLQILPSHVTESDTIHLRKIATPKRLFFQQYYLSYFCLPKCQGRCKLFVSKCPETISDAWALLLSKLFEVMLWVQPGTDLSSMPHAPTSRGICMLDWSSEERQLLPTNNPTFWLSPGSRRDQNMNVRESWHWSHHISPMANKSHRRKEHEPVGPVLRRNVPTLTVLWLLNDSLQLNAALLNIWKRKLKFC